MIVLGIDPGSRRAGWGVLRQDGSRVRLIALGVLRVDEDAPLPTRLACMHRDLSAVLSEHDPDLVAVEAVFHGPSTRSLVTLGQARGALLAAAGARRAPLVELSPAEIKKAVTGRGGATKGQVAHMVAALLGSEALTGRKVSADATDALAVAIAALHRRGLESRLLLRRG